MTVEKSSWYERVPRVELHLHLTGAIPHRTLWELIQKYGGDPSVPDISALPGKFRYRDFRHFLETWVWKNRFLREYEDFSTIAESVAGDLADQNVLYAEISVSASRFSQYGLNVAGLVDAVRTGFSRVPAIETGLIIDLVRDNPPERASEMLDEIKDIAGTGVIGITIGGSEQDFPPGPFAGVYEKAREMGLHTSAHAGEAAGPESVWGAVGDLKVDRIGHGTRAIEDEKLVDYLAGYKIPVEICLLSNLRTGVILSIEDHPVRKYFEKGIPLSINTDDPKMFGNSLAEEYETLENRLGFSRNELKRLILQGVETSWLPESRKKELAEKMTGHPDW